VPVLVIDKAFIVSGLDKMGQFVNHDALEAARVFLRELEDEPDYARLGLAGTPLVFIRRTTNFWTLLHQLTWLTKREGFVQRRLAQDGIVDELYADPSRTASNTSATASSQPSTP
jgi:hypothetical protein